MDQDELAKKIAQAADEGWTTLDLTANRLTALPPEIGNLTNLTGLDLRGNHLRVLTREMMELMDRGIGSFSGNPYNG